MGQEYSVNMAGFKNAFQIESDTVNVKSASRKILDTLKGRNLDEKTTFDIRLSIEEALCNAIIHGNNRRKELPVRISYSVDGGKLAVEIEDTGDGFDLAKLPGPTADENLLKTSGRGVYLIRKHMDEVVFNDKGNKIRMIKYLKS